MHWDSKRQTDAIVSMSKGAMINNSRKHKLNAGSSTKSELVSMVGVLGMMMYCKYFMGQANASTKIKECVLDC